MPKKGENIRRRKDGRWEARYRQGVDGNGKIIYASIYAKTYKEVKQKKLLVLSGRLPSDEPVASVSFAQVQQLWWAQNSVHFKPSTERKYAYLLQRHILPELGGIKISRITAPGINKLLAQKIKAGRLDGTGGLSPAYVRSITLLIRSIMQFAAAEKYCQPLCSNINKPTAEAKEIRVLSPQQRIKLEAAICHHPSATEIGILTAMYTGMRIGEICALSWNDVDLDNRLITVRHTVCRVNAQADTGLKSQWVLDTPKTAASLRVIPICSGLFKLLSAYKIRSVSPFVVSTASSFVSPRTFEYRFHGVLRSHGIDRINFHALRHGFATSCVENAVDVKSLSEILGHASELVTLRTYVHSSLDTKRAQLEKLSSAYAY